MFKGLLSTISDMRGDRRATVLVWTALCAVPMFGMMGLALDYASAISTKSKLDMAADAAAMSAITKAQTVIMGHAGTTGTALTDGATQAKLVFKANAGAVSFAAVPDPTVTVQRVGQTLTAQVTYTAANQNNFGKFFGIGGANVTGHATSSLSMSKYINIYLLVDISQSMGIVAALGDMDKMLQLTTNTPLGSCVFGCHLPIGSGLSNQEIAQNAHIPLRIDVIRSAINDMIGQVQAVTANTSTVNIGIYTMEMNLTTLIAPTSSYSALQTAASGINLGPDNDSGQNADTYTQAVLDNFASIVPTSGDGTTPTNAQNFVFIMTDGTSDVYDTQSNFNHRFDTYHSSWNSIINLKKNSTIGIIYTTYYPIYNHNNPALGLEYNYSNTIDPIHTDIQPELKKVATTSDWFIEATDQGSINMALNKFLLQALAAARLTN